MTSELHTNLILNDTRFTQGLERADRGVSGFLGRMGKSVGDMNKIMKLAGLVQIGQSVVNKFDDMHAAQVRMATGAETFRDKWAQSKGLLYEIGGYVPVLGDLFQKVWYSADGGPMQEAAYNASTSLQNLNRDLRLQTQILRANSDEERKAIELKREAAALYDKVNAAVAIAQAGDMKVSGEGSMRNVRDYTSERERQLQLSIDEARVRAKADADAKTAAEEADRRRERLEASRSTFSFNERIEAEDTAIMRLKGFDAEADRREIEADTRRRIREVLDDQTVGPEELGRRLREVYRTSNERMALLKEKPPDAFDRSITASGVNSATLGQMFGPTMTVGNSIAAKAAAAAEKAAAENKRQTELLKSIDRGIQRVGTRYAS